MCIDGMVVVSFKCIDLEPMLLVSSSAKSACLYRVICLSRIHTDRNIIICKQCRHSFGLYLSAHFQNRINFHFHQTTLTFTDMLRYSCTFLSSSSRWLLTQCVCVSLSRSPCVVFPMNTRSCVASVNGKK